MVRISYTRQQILKVLLFNALSISPILGFTQTLSPSFSDDFYVREQVKTSRPVPYVSEREADIMWSKRVWRTIDLREQFNHPLYYPEAPLNNRKSLFDVVKRALLDGEIVAFDNPLTDDAFTMRMRLSQLDSLFNPVDSQDVPNPDIPEELMRTGIPNPLTSNKIKAWWIKEDWFFDRQRGVMDVRIIGLCPLQEHLDNEGQIDGYKPLFWLYFDQLRPVLAREECYNFRNNAQRLSYDDVFRKRMFQSYIRQESNVYNRVITDYLQGLDATLEADRIRMEIANAEQNYWHY
jgi:gliding motility associated protien GldN